MTLTGPGGCGKTRLAVAVAAAAALTTCWLDLAPVDHSGRGGRGGERARAGARALGGPACRARGGGGRRPRTAPAPGGRQRGTRRGRRGHLGGDAARPLSRSAGAGDQPPAARGGRRAGLGRTRPRSPRSTSHRTGCATSPQRVASSSGSRPRAVATRVATKRRSWRGSAAGWTGCRWRSSWRPPGRPRCRSVSSTTGCPTRCTCSPADRAPAPTGTARCGRRSTGRTRCSTNPSASSSGGSRSSRDPSGSTPPRRSVAPDRPWTPSPRSSGTRS